MLGSIIAIYFCDTTPAILVPIDLGREKFCIKGVLITSGSSVRLIIQGIILVLIMLVVPQSILGFWRMLKK